MVVGVASIFAYLIGSLVLTFVLRKIASEDDFALSEHGEGLGYAALFIVMGAIAQALREGRGSAGEVASVDGNTEPRSPKEFLWPLALLVGPLLAAWAQFELHFDDVRMFPVASVAGGIWLGVVLGGRLSGSRYRSTAAMLTIALCTLPLALLSIVFPAAHFRTYGSNVVVVVEDSADFSRREYPFEATLPDAPTLDPQGLGSGTASLIDALADAKPVEAVEIEGVTYLRNEEGELEPMELSSAEELFAMAEEEDKREREAEIAAYELEYAEHEARIARLRRSGRLFSSPD